MDLSTMRARVQGAFGNRDDLTDTITDEFINDAYRSLANSFVFDELFTVDTTIDTVDGTATVSFPSDARTILSIRDTENDVDLRARDIHWYDEQDDSSDNEGEPRYYVVWEGKIYLFPTPDDAYDLRVRYRKDITVLSSDGDTPEIPNDWHNIIWLMAASRAGFYLGLDDRGINLKNEALGEIAARQEDRTTHMRQVDGQIAAQRTKPAGWAE